MKLPLYLLSLSLLIPTMPIKCGILSRFTQSFRTWAPRTGTAFGVGYWFTNKQEPENEIKPGAEFLKAYYKIAFHFQFYGNTLTNQQFLEYHKTGSMLKKVADIECTKVNEESSCYNAWENYRDAVESQKYSALSDKKISAEQSEELVKSSIDLVHTAELKQISKKEAATFATNENDKRKAERGYEFFGEGFRESSSGKLKKFNARCAYGDCVQYRPDVFKK